MFSSDAWTQIERSLRLSGRELQIVRGSFDDKTEFAMAADLQNHLAEASCAMLRRFEV